ncbi:MAG: addiction module protein [Thermodesulfobacteriota bacterium]
MVQDIPIEKMSLAEKLQLMERLWDDLARHHKDLPSPDWHGDVLAERMKAIQEGRTGFEDWEAAKKWLLGRHK